MMENTCMKKKVRWSRYVKVMTFIFLPFIFATDVWMLIQLFSADSQLEIYFDLCVFLILTSTIIAVFVFAPKEIEVSDFDLCLYRGIGNVKINLFDIVEVSSYKSVGVEIRIFGISGIFGEIGKYRNRKIGNYISYVGDYSQAFLVKRTDGKKYLFSCEDRDEIVLLLKSRIGKK